MYGGAFLTLIGPSSSCSESPPRVLIVSSSGAFGERGLVKDGAPGDEATEARKWQKETSNPHRVKTSILIPARPPFRRPEAVCKIIQYFASTVVGANRLK